MPTWTKNLSNGAQMIMEDTGTQLRMSVKGPTPAPSGTVWIYWNLQISYSDGTVYQSGSNSAGFVSGSGTQQLGVLSVSKSGYAQFTITSTSPAGTGFGSVWPEILAGSVQRGSVPYQHDVVITGKTFTSLTAQFKDGNTGGNPITSRELRCSTSLAGPWTTVSVGSNNATHTFSNLAPSTNYYLQARASNVIGAGDWEAGYADYRQAFTSAGAFIKDGGVWKTAIPYVNDNGVWKPGYCTVRHLGTWKDTQ